MVYLYLFLAMLFCHVVDDYVLQGCLANLKQKGWWEKNAADELYKHDYLMALFMHSFSWTFSITLPLFIFTGFNLGWLLCMFPINVITHMVVDDLKANRHKINLIQDQLIHIGQIIITLTLFIIMRSI